MSAKKPVGRPARSEKVRVPLGARNRLTFGDLDPKFNYRVINDDQDRLARAEEAGYEFVQSEGKLGDNRAAEGTSMGANVAKPVGGGMTGYLMRIPKKFYEEDQAAKEAKIKEKENTFIPDGSKGQYGEGLTNDT
jgi:hypothetical protein